jgi:parallel beta-helix repeat protein
VVEDNTIVGNANGIFLVAGTQGNTFLRNLVTGNPPVQVSLDNPSSIGYDIKNMAASDANTFEGNICLSSVNAPCPSVGPSLTASPNPISVTGSTTVGMTTLSWNAPYVQVIEIHVGSLDGPLLTRMGNRGSVQTGAWVTDNTSFYLQDVSGNKPLTSDYTLATVVVRLQRSGSASLHFRGGPGIWASGAPLVLLLLAGCFVRLRTTRLGVVKGGAALLAGAVFCLFPATLVAQSSGQQPPAELDRMIAAHRSQQELALYVFETQGCKGCHTVGQNGKLGFTERGTQTAKGFEGCIAMLTAVSHIAQVPAEQRSSQQQKKVARFDEYGCTFCHRVGAGKMAMTDLGTKLANLHLGCVDIEKTLASKR